MAKSEVFRVNNRVFISHSYPVGYAIDLLATLARALAAPLTAMFGFEVKGTLEGVAQAMPALKDADAGRLLELLPAFESAGGSRLIVKVLAYTRFEDQPIDSVERLNAVFGEPGEGLLDALTLCWEVLVWNLAPLVRAIQKRMQQKAAETDPPKE